MEVPWFHIFVVKVGHPLFVDCISQNCFISLFVKYVKVQQKSFGV